MLTDIASIGFVAVTMNHLGLVRAVERATGLRLWVVNCVKCLSFWLVLLYLLFASCDLFHALAISFLASYAATWLELFEGMIDTIYLYLYEKTIARHRADAPAADPDEGRPAGSVSELRQSRKGRQAGEEVR